MAEEDDSLLQQFPDLDQTPALNYSPFALPPSHPNNLKDGVSMQKPSSSSSETTYNKENINSNGVEVQKLGMEPMQMKRRKKGGGYNLRKSLAWDRAFFTDEGILDPLELTLITGINANTYGEGLPTISEEHSSSFSPAVRCTNQSNDVEASEEAPLKALRDKNRTTNGNKEKIGCSMRYHDSLLHNKVTRKVLSSNCTNRGRSKVGGCSEPLAASSLKRPANSNTLKTAKKESKLPKLPISKPRSYSYATTKTPMAASQSRHNLIPKPTRGVEKNSGVKKSLQDIQGSQRKAKTGSSDLRLPVKNLIHSSKAASSTKSQSVHPVQFDKANSRSEMVQDTLQLCKVQDESTALAAKHHAPYAAANSNNSLHEAPRLSSSGSCHIQRASKGLMVSDRLHPCKSQERPAALAMPSGLKLPSPSLRFFDQITASESGSLQQQKIQQYMGSDRKIGEPPPPTRLSMKSNGFPENVCYAPSTQLSPSPNYMLNTVSEGVHGHQNPVTKIVPMVDIQLEYECIGSEQEKRIIGDEEIAAQASHPIMQLAGNVGTCRQPMSEGKVSETRNKSLFHNKDDGLQSYTAFSLPTFGQSIHHQEENISSGVNDLAQTSWEQADTEKSDDAPSKVNFHSHLDAGNQVFVESEEQDEIRKREDDVGTTKCSVPGIENRSVVLQQGHENDVSNVVDDGNLPIGITENLSSVVLTSSIECCAPSTQLSPPPSWMLNTSIKGVPDSNSHQNLVTKVVPKVDIKLEYECRGSEQEKRIHGHDEIAATWVGVEGTKVSHPTEQLAGNVGTCQLMIEGRVPETRYKSVLCNREDGPQSYTAFSMSTFGQSIQHQEENILTVVDDLAETSWDQADTGKSDDAPPKVNPEFHFDAGSQVFVESQEQDEIRQIENDAGTTKCIAPGIEIYSVVLQQGQENDVSEVLDGRSLPMEEDDSPCSRTGSITFRDSHSPEDVGDVIELKSIDTSCTSFQNLYTEQRNDDAGGIDVFPTTTTLPHVRDPSAEESNRIHFNLVTSIRSKAQLNDSRARDTVIQFNDNSSAEGFNIESTTWNKYLPGTLFLHDNPSSTVGFHFIPTTSTKNKSQLQDNGAAKGSPKCLEATTLCISSLQNSQRLVSCTVLAESSCLEEGTFPNASNINDHLSQEKSVSNDILVEVPCQKQDGAYVDLIPREVAPLTDDQNQSSSLSHLRPQVEIICETASLGDGTLVKRELVVQRAHGTSTYPQSLERERLDRAAPTVEAQLKITKENHKSQEMGKIFVAAKSQGSCGNILEAKLAVQGGTGGLETHSQFQSENQTLEGSGPISNIFKTNVEDGQPQLLDDALVQSCSRLTSDVHNHSIESADHSDILGKEAGLSNTGIKLERVSRCNEYFQQESVCKAVWNAVERSDVYECDPKPPNTITVDAALPVAEEGQICVEYRTSGSTVMDSIAEHNENYRDGQSAECGDLILTLDSELEPPVEDNMFVKNLTCMEYCSTGEESCSFPTDSMLEEKTALFLDDQVLMKDRLLTAEKILDSISVQEVNTNGSAQILPMLLVDGDDQPQCFDGNMPLVETYDYFTDGQSNSRFSVSQQLTAGVETASTPVLDCLVGGEDESLLTKTTYMMGTEGSKISIGEQVDAVPTVGELHHEFDDRKDNKDATILINRSNSIKRQDNSVVIHPPNAVPFSDEWLAAFEAAGEEILTMKCGAVQHSPQDKSLPEPSPWSPSQMGESRNLEILALMDTCQVKKKANQIGPYDCTKYTNAMQSNSQLSNK